MPRSNLKSLIGKLNTTCRKPLESAAGLCLAQTHYEVDLEHFLIKLLEIPDSDLQKILRHFEINDTRPRPRGRNSGSGCLRPEAWWSLSSRTETSRI